MLEFIQFPTELFVAKGRDYKLWANMCILQGPSIQPLNLRSSRAVNDRGLCDYTDYDHRHHSSVTTFVGEAQKINSQEECYESGGIFLND